ncbi:acetylglutamate kinase [candidate division KSB1 bacterium]
MVEEYQKAVKLFREGMPYIKEFQGSTFLIKYGGAALDMPITRRDVTGDIVLLSYVGINPVIVHGGGKEIDRIEEKMGVSSGKKDGIRVTECMDSVVAGLAKCNEELVGIINQVGGKAIGISGSDGGLITPRPYGKDYGKTGSVGEINPEVIFHILNIGYIPVISTYATCPDGTCYNVNADEVAGHLAIAVNARKLIMLTDTPGILEKKDDEESLMETIKSSSIETLKSKGIISGGMVPKIEACCKALKGGVKKAHILDGRKPGSLLVELLTKKGVGTEIVLD